LHKKTRNAELVHLTDDKQLLRSSQTNSTSTTSSQQTSLYRLADVSATITEIKQMQICLAICQKFTRK